MHGQTGHILAVDDDVVHRKTLALILSRAGFTVATAEDAVAGLELARREQFDLVISDYHMPDYPGTDFIRLLRRDQRYAATPVILLTARADELNVPKLRDELAVMVMSKPCSLEQVVSTVSRCLDVARRTIWPQLQRNAERQAGPSAGRGA
jgi:two-component system chemotaxis response regulator CheY